MLNYNSNSIKTGFFALGIALSCSTPSLSQASGQDHRPEKYSSCQGVAIKDVAGSSGYKFSKDCSTVFVLPPQTGHLAINDFSPSYSLDQSCSSIRTIKDTNSKYLKTENIYAKRMLRNAERIEKIESYFDEGLLPVGATEEELEEKMDRLIDRNTKMQTAVEDNDAKYVRKMQTYAQIEGGTANFTISDEFEALVQKFREANTGNDIQFEKMPIESGFLSFGDKDVDNETAKLRMPAVLAMGVQGLQSIPQLPSLTAIIEDANASTEPEQGSAVDIFNGSLGGGIEFSISGACQVVAASVDDEDFSISDVKAHLQASSIYEYQLQVHRKHSIRFKMDELIHKIHTQKKKGGLFSKKTINKLIDNQRTGSWLEFDIESGDQRFEYTDAYIQQVKAEFLDRALKQILAFKTGDPRAHLALLDPSGENGADAISGALNKCPHLYCQIGAAGFKVLSKIFGSTKAVSEMKKTFKGEFSEVVNESRMLPQVGTMTFE